MQKSLIAAQSKRAAAKLLYLQNQSPHVDPQSNKRKRKAQHFSHHPVSALHLRAHGEIAALQIYFIIFSYDGALSLIQAGMFAGLL